MSRIDFEDEPFYLKPIQTALELHGLVFDPEEGWAVHEDLGYRVFVGRAAFADRVAQSSDTREDDERPGWFWVAIYPRGKVYKIWYRPSWWVVCHRSSDYQLS